MRRFTFKKAPQIRSRHGARQTRKVVFQDTALFGPSYPTTDPLVIRGHRVGKGINPSEAAGPDQIPCKLLKEACNDLLPYFP